jgi:hypothetical protein
MLVCPNCGVTTQMLKPEFDYHKQPLFFCSYSRSKRFGALLSRVLLPCFEKHDAKMFRFLNTYKPYESVEDIMNRMKLSDLKDKRYCSLHLFARYFMPCYTAPDHRLQFHKTIMFSFRDVERNFSRFPNKPFFNYPWLLRKLLFQHSLSDYICFVKPIRCEKRNLYYENLFKQVMNGNIDAGGRGSLGTSHETVSELENGPPTTLFQRTTFLRCGLGNLLDAAGKNSRIACTRSHFEVGNPLWHLLRAAMSQA